MNARFLVRTMGILLLGVGSLRAEPIPVVNGSFELPETEFVELNLRSWTKFPKPDWFIESPEQMWEQLIGVFRNTTPGQADYIDNIEGNQAIYLFAVPETGFFQDQAVEPDATARFETGKAYRLTFGIAGGGGGMREGVTLSASLYYRETNGTMTAVASTPVTHSTALFPTLTHLLDFDVVTEPVKETDPWAGRNIGIMFTSIPSPDLAGGYWDIDNVRLSTIEPAVQGVSLRIERVEEGVRISWLSQEGKSYQVQSSADLQNWAAQGELVGGNGGEIAQTLSISGRSFFRLEER